MGGVHPIRNVLRIDNVETRQAERITANDEDRQRQGFEIQTVFAWSQREGGFDVAAAMATDSDGPILSLHYAPGAAICRLNKGLRRRKEKSIFGFGIDPATGRWMGSPADGDGDVDPDEPIRQRVVPIVQDYKNALLLRVTGEQLSQEAMATLQHAIARGLEIVFQLEEGEIQTEPVPTRDNRRGILIFEATEGGAGVLGRLTSDPKALSNVARTALGLMHYHNLDAAIASAHSALLQEDENAHCVKGCYRCLLSYYNQPDHEQIDRTDNSVLSLLLRLAGSSAVIEKRSKDGEPQNHWYAAIASWGLPSPDPEPLTVTGTTFPFAWRSNLVAAAIGPVDSQIRADAEALGYSIAVLPESPADMPPPELVSLFGQTA
jgi:hypothetical protein